MPASEHAVAEWFEAHRRFLWRLCYRITGSSADADDLVQETFVKALQRSPDYIDDPRSWLVRVAVNAARDVLRRRKHREYIGSWLPSPIETAENDMPRSFEPIVEGQSLAT